MMFLAAAVPFELTRVFTQERTFVNSQCRRKLFFALAVIFGFTSLLLSLLPIFMELSAVLNTNGACDYINDSVFFMTQNVVTMLLSIFGCLVGYVRMWCYGKQLFFFPYELP